MHSSTFQTKTALKTGGIAFCVAFVVGILLLFLAPSTADTQRLGQSVGQFAGISFIGGFLASFQEQTGHPLAARILKIVWVLVCVGLVAFALTYSPEGTAS
mgnify:CR=1 FL=1